MPDVVRAFCAGIALVLAVSAGPVRGQPAAGQQDADDMRCAKAPLGTVEPLPALVAGWVTILCTPTGQALAPPVTDRQVVWLTRRDGAIFVLPAMPIASLPANFTRYDMRFEKFAAHERGGAALPDMLRMWRQAFGGPEPKIDRVVQLDALSVWDRMVFNLFFYLADGKPHTIIVCADRCNRHVSVDIVEP